MRADATATDLWRPDGDSVSWSDAAWTGAAYAIALHATLNFFSVALPSLESVLFVFEPAERLAFGLAHDAPALGKWLLLLASLSLYGVLAGLGLRAVALEVVALARRVCRPRVRDQRAAVRT